MSVEVHSVKIGRWYQAAGQYRRILNLDTDGKVTYELFDHNHGTSGRLRVPVETFAKVVDDEMQPPLVFAE